MSNTGYKFNNEDLITIFSSNVGNTTYAPYYNNLNSLDVISSANTIIKGSNTIGFKSPLNSNADLVSIFSPIYTDITTSGTTTINVPTWAKKIGFVVQAAGGKGGISYTDYWIVTNKPVGGQVNSYNRTYGTAYTRTYGRYYYQNEDIQTWKRGQSSAGNQPYQTSAATQVASYRTNYTRDGTALSQAYNGSGGGGGGCCAGIYTINAGDVPSTITISHNYNNSYSTIQFNDSVSTLIKANNGVDVESNSGTGTSGAPIATVYPSTNTSKDTVGTGGSAIAAPTTDPQNRISNYFNVAGSNGGAGSSTDTGTVGNCGFYNDVANNSSNITNKFVPNISNTIGNGGLGSTTSTRNNGQSGIVRYWFIR